MLLAPEGPVIGDGCTGRTGLTGCVDGASKERLCAPEVLEGPAAAWLIKPKERPSQLFAKLV